MLFAEVIAAMKQLMWAVNSLHQGLFMPALKEALAAGNVVVVALTFTNQIFWHLINHG